MKGKYIVLGLVLLIAVSFALGVYWNGRGDHEWRNAELDRLQVEREAAKTQLQIEMGRRWALFKWGMSVAVACVALASMAGIGYGAVRLLNRRADALYPDANGIFPVHRLRGGDGVLYLHDANRVVGPITAYGKSGAVPLMSGDTDTQRAVTTQAQAAQFVAASHQGVTPETVQGILQGVAQVGSRYLPAPDEIEVADIEPSHIERLLIEAGEIEG